MEFNSLVKEIISEALDNPYPFKWSEKDGGFVFFPDPNNQKVLYTVMTLEDPEYPQRLNILFHYTDEDKNIQGTTDMTGTGNAFRIMATVVKIVNFYLDSYGPNKYNIIEFSAKSADHGKVVLYKRLAQQLKNQLGPKWELDVFKNSYQVVFELSKEA
jgi:hypothetical protein